MSEARNILVIHAKRFSEGGSPSLESDLLYVLQEIESLTAERDRLRKALEVAAKRLYKEGAPHSYVDDAEAVLNGIEVEYYEE